MAVSLKNSSLGVRGNRYKKWPTWWFDCTMTVAWRPTSHVRFTGTWHERDVQPLSVRQPTPHLYLPL